MQKIVILEKVHFVHCLVLTLMLNLWSYWACIKRGKYYERLSDCIEWNLFYIERRWPSYYLLFEIIYEKIKKQDELFRPGYFVSANEKHYGHFSQSLEC